MAPDFKADLVASRLFASYMNQARALLDTEPRHPDREEAELRSALKWLGRALEVRPEDPEATLQQRLVRDYLQGLLAYRQASWETVIIRLSNVYTEAPDYRAGRVASLLQEAYVQTGLHHLQNGRLDRALERFRQAIAIGLQGYARPVPGQASSLLVRADKLAEQRRTGRAVALYGEILGMMGFDDVASLLAANVTEMPEAWRQRLLCPAPADDGGCTDLLAWRRALQEGSLQIAEPSEKQPGETAAMEAQVYVVRPGDTLIEIAMQFGTTIRALVEANPIIKDPWLIRPGWQLVIPSRDSQ
jgi:tetratricopeptide (TPR) repeat protein